MEALGRAPIRIAFYALLALALVWAALPDAAHLDEFRDAQVLALYEHAAVDTVKRFGELPLWNPYYCGGLDALGAPQSRWASPTFLVSLLLGPERAEIVIVYLLVVFGMEGMYRWLRLRVTCAGPAAVVAPAFAMCGQFSVAWFRGWIGFFGFELVPWILLGVTLAARGRTRGIAIASCVFAIVLGFGGTFAAPLVAVAAMLEAARAIFESRHRARSIAMLVATAAFMATVACFRLWPILETLSSAPRIMGGTPGHAPAQVWSMLTGALEVEGRQDFTNDAGTFYVGYAFLAVVALGSAERRSIRALVLTMACAWLAAGYSRKPALFALLRELPIFAALRYPERFLWLAIAFGSEPAAHAIAKLPILGEGRRFRIGTWAILLGALGWTYIAQVRSFAYVSGERRLGAATHAPTRDFHQTRGNRWLATHVADMGVGSLSCWETHAVVESAALRADLPAEEYIADPSAGRAKRIAWSPNRIAIDTTLTRDGTLLVNQNWHPGWHSSFGRVVSRDGLLAVELPPGERVVTLAFRPWSAVAGTTVTLAALAALAILGVRARRGRIPFSRGARAATVSLVVLPWAVAIAAWRMSPEAPWPTSAPRNADGTGAFVASAPPDARIDAHFDLPVRLEAASVSAPDAHANVAITLYLRRTGALPRETAVFVHLLPEDLPPSEGINADHQIVASSFYLSDAPEGALVRDSFAVHLDKKPPGAWTVWVGFGHVSARRGRAKLLDATNARSRDDMVAAGTFVVR
jgi:hypothetical protein